MTDRRRRGTSIIHQRAACLIRASLPLLAAATLAGCADAASFLRPAGPVAETQRDLFALVVGLMLLIIVPIFVAVPLVLWRYRRSRPRGAYQPDWAWSKPLEFLTWGVPIAIVLVIGTAIWIATHALDPYKPLKGAAPPLRIQAVALDWKWLFVYPDAGVASADRLVVPAGRPVTIDLTSDTVMQSLLVPRLAGQIYAMAGMTTHLNLMADAPGRFVGENTQYNGEGFHRQHFEVLALPSMQYDAWLRSTRAARRPLDAATYARLSRRSVLAGPVGFSAVEPRLFERVVARYGHAMPMDMKAGIRP